MNYPTAIFSEDRKYRYTLWRQWVNAKELFDDTSEWTCTKCGAGLDTGEDHECSFRFVQFIGLNPSTADETNDDPTIRRCIQFCKDWGFDGYCMTNIFAYRATDPGVMKLQADPIGPKNDDWLVAMSFKADLIICAWGTHGGYRQRGAQVKGLLRALHGRTLHHLGLTKEGYPQH